MESSVKEAEDNERGAEDLVNPKNQQKTDQAQTQLEITNLVQLWPLDSTRVVSVSVKPAGLCPNIVQLVSHSPAEHVKMEQQSTVDQNPGLEPGTCQGSV